MAKGQAAIEFLTTYGWAILLVIIGILALAYFGVFDYGDTIPQQCLITGGMSCVDYRISASEIRMHVMNNMGSQAQVSEVKLVNNKGESCTVIGYPVTIPGGSRAQFNATGCISGSIFRGEITIDYQLTDERESHSLSGVISGNVNG